MSTGSKVTGNFGNFGVQTKTHTHKETNIKFYKVGSIKWPIGLNPLKGIIFLD